MGLCGSAAVATRLRRNCLVKTDIPGCNGALIRELGEIAQLAYFMRWESIWGFTLGLDGALPSL